MAFRLWEPADVDPLATGLTAAGVTIRQSKSSRQDTAPKKWRQYLLGLWRRHQHKPEVQKLYQSKLLFAQQLLSDCCTRRQQAQGPVTFENWYTPPRLLPVFRQNPPGAVWWHTGRG